MKKDKRIKHNKFNHPLYNIWNHMMDRCYNKNNKQYKNYGGRGITVDPCWHDVCNFIRDMDNRPKGLTLERIDNSKNYNKKNCTWASRQTQIRNRRNTLKATYRNETKTVKEWSEQYNIKYSVLWERLSVGWSIERALNVPVSCHNSGFKSHRNRQPTWV